MLLIFLNFDVLEFGDTNDGAGVIFLVWVESVSDRKSWSDLGLSSFLEASMIMRGLAGILILKLKSVYTCLYLVDNQYSAHNSVVAQS